MKRLLLCNLGWYRNVQEATLLLDAAGENKRVRLREVSKAQTSPFGLLSALAIGAVAQVAKGEQVSMQSLAAALLTGQLQSAAFQNGVTSNGAVMAVMPDIQVSTPRLPVGAAVTMWSLRGLQCLLVSACSALTGHFMTACLHLCSCH